jgi:chemotaxis protein methyltransferase CheR
MITFQQHNILEPMTRALRFDLVLCRNVLLYFCADTRRRAFDRLAEAMRPDGWLMLGAGETSVGHTDAFIPEKKLPGLYRALPLAANRSVTTLGHGSPRRCSGGHQNR